MVVLLLVMEIHFVDQLDWSSLESGSQLVSLQVNQVWSVDLVLKFVAKELLLIGWTGCCNDS